MAGLGLVAAGWGSGDAVSTGGEDAGPIGGEEFDRRSLDPETGESRRAAATIREVIDAILAEIGADLPENTVDTFKSADPDVPLTGVATTFLATTRVVEQAIEEDLNLILPHEPTFYNHRDETEWLEGDPVYRHKRDLLEEHGVVVWRFHDAWHQWTPDPITDSLLDEIGWTDRTIEDGTGIVEVEPVSLQRLARRVKTRLALPTVRIAGDPNLTCRRVGLIPGAAGGESHVEFLRRDDVDAVLIGETSTWTSPEYARDSARTAHSRGLVEVGHQATEEAGMGFVTAWIDRHLRSVVGDVPIRHIPAGDPFMHV